VRRILTAAALAAAASLALAGCASGPPPAANPQSVKYLADSQARALAGPTKAPVVDTKAAAAKIQALVKGNAPLVISVLGDSTGDKPGEWVDLWAKHLAQYGTVTLHLWSEGSGDWLPDVITYPGPARKIDIWNGSKPGASHAYALENLAKIQPVKPTFQILNYGHNYLATRADGGEYDLLAALTEKWKAAVPTALTLQNPAQGERAVRSEASQMYIREWAVNKYPVIDVYTPFKASGNLPALILSDGIGVHPNTRGQILWVDTVIKALG
jgi:hypothetical protein